MVAVAEVFEPARLGPVELRNRVIKAATFEGMTPRGLVTDELIEFHLRPARGGVGMTTVASCAVSPEGRTDPAARARSAPPHPVRPSGPVTVHSLQQGHAHHLHRYPLRPGPPRRT